MPTVSYYLSTIDHPIDENHPLWHSPLPGKRLPGTNRPESVDTEAVTYGQYFSSVFNFCGADGWDRMIRAASRRWARPVVKKDLERLTIFLEKHGAFYHPARVRVTFLDQTLSFVINVAASNLGRQALSREVKALERLNDQRPFGWFPQVYSFAPGGLPMFLGDWFDGFHEFHLTRRTDSDELALVLWDGAAVRCLLSDKQAADLYRQAAMILAASYDPLTACQIFPWHHAAGDFVVQIAGDVLTVRLITVRDYVPMAGSTAEPADERALLDALLVFFLHLSVRMRLDRLDGVSTVVWASDHCLVPMIDGFFQGLDLTARMSGFPVTFTETFRQYFNHHDAADLCALARRITGTVFDRRSEENQVIGRHLEHHVNRICRILSA